MNIVIISTIILSLINIINATNTNYGIRIRNTTLRMFILNDKKNMKLFKEFKKHYEIYYNKSIAYISQGIIDYNVNLSEDEKSIIEIIISLCY